jgi:hypothetical protein
MKVEILREKTVANAVTESVSLYEWDKPMLSENVDMCMTLASSHLGQEAMYVHYVILHSI